MDQSAQTSVRVRENRGSVGEKESTAKVKNCPASERNKGVDIAVERAFLAGLQESTNYGPLAEESLNPSRLPEAKPRLAELGETVTVLTNKQIEVDPFFIDDDPDEIVVSADDVMSAFDE